MPAIYEHPLRAYCPWEVIEPWTDEWRFKAERKLWHHVLQFQAGYGLFSHIEDLDAKLQAYETAAGLDIVSTQDIEDRERVTHHDVKARIEVFNELAAGFYDFQRWRKEDDEAFAQGGYTPMEYSSLELAHVGLTSADVVDNISLVQMATSTRALRQVALDHGDTERVKGFTDLLCLIPFRGLKGPVGTQQDLLDLFHGNEVAIVALEEHLAETFGVEGGVLTNTGQVYPRSLDLMVASRLLSVVGGMQPWHTILSGYGTMCAEYSGSTWNEGDVSTSVTRRVALPGLFLAAGAAVLSVEL